MATFRVPHNVPTHLLDRWFGVHPTPPLLVALFASQATSFAVRRLSKDGVSSVRLLDLCAGDGRLGIAVSQALEKRLHVRNLTFLEISPERAKTIPGLKRGMHIKTGDAVTWRPGRKFDVVVSNPPYQALNRAIARSLGIEWRMAVLGARNLYGVILHRALELCAPGGIVAAIAPFGWLSGYYGKAFRKHLEEQCATIQIIGNQSRSIFSNVQQDTAVILLQKKKFASEPDASVVFGLARGGMSVPTKGTLLPFVSPPNEGLQVRVGGVVWNRAKHLLTSSKRGTVPVIYGGNIASDGTLKLHDKRYHGRQYIRDSSVSHLIIEGPCLVLRRVMKGRPGKWRANVCFVENGFRFAPENHILYATLPEGATRRDYEHLRSWTERTISERFSLAGSPSLSARLLTEAIASEYRSELSKLNKRAS